MNHECRGDIYEFDGRTWLRCFRDSTIIDISGGQPDICPNCGRLAAPQRHQSIPLRRVVLVEVHIDGRWIKHSAEVVPLTPALTWGAR